MNCAWAGKGADYGVNLTRGPGRGCVGRRLTLHSSLVSAPKRPHHGQQYKERQRFHGRKAKHGFAGFCGLRGFCDRGGVARTSVRVRPDSNSTRLADSLPQQWQYNLAAHCHCRSPAIGQTDAERRPCYAALLPGALQQQLHASGVAAGDDRVGRGVAEQHPPTSLQAGLHGVRVGAVDAQPYTRRKGSGTCRPRLGTRTLATTVAAASGRDTSSSCTCSTASGERAIRSRYVTVPVTESCTMPAASVAAAELRLVGLVQALSKAAVAPVSSRKWFIA